MLMLILPVGKAYRPCMKELDHNCCWLKRSHCKCLTNICEDKVSNPKCHRFLILLSNARFSTHSE
jgi:hypothetical protein